MELAMLWFTTNSAPTDFQHSPEIPALDCSTCGATAIVFLQNCKQPHHTEGLAKGRKTTSWHSSSADVVYNVPTQPLAGCLSNSDGSWPFPVLFSNKMAFKMLLTPHNSLMVPFTRASQALHPNSDLPDSLAAYTQGCRAARMEMSASV